jgi:predicted phosphodiesterase
MKIKLLSDLHLEGRRGYQRKLAPKWASYNNEDVLVLAGDIAVGTHNVIDALEYFQKLGYPHIVYVAGNHECYHHSYKEFYELKRCLKDLEHIHLLDAQEIVKIQDVSFFGGTLWTNFNNDPLAELAAKDFITDFKVIDGFTTKMAIAEYQRQSAFIKQAYEITEGKKVIVTHFLPAQECIPPRFRNSNLNDYFANSLDNWIYELKDTTWLFGHTHDPTNLTIGETRLYANPLGYSHEQSKMDPSLVIEV